MTGLWSGFSRIMKRLFLKDEKYFSKILQDVNTLETAKVNSFTHGAGCRLNLTPLKLANPVVLLTACAPGQSTGKMVGASVVVTQTVEYLTRERLSFKRDCG